MSDLQFTVQQEAPQSAPPPEYAKYPMVMVHPHARKAERHGVPGTEKRHPGTGEIIPGEFWSYGGSSDFMPPVTVNNQDQEAYQAAQGYRPGGQGDVAAFSNLTAGATIKPHVVEEWPAWHDGVLYQTEADYLADHPRQTPSPKAERKAPTPGIGRPRRKSPSSRSEAMKAAWAARKAATEV